MTQDFTTRNGLPNDTITALAESLSGQIWIGTRNGLLIQDEAGLRELGYADGLASKRINHIYQAQDGPLRIATAEGALTYTNRRLRLSDALRAADVRHVGEAEDHWVFVTEKGVLRLPREKRVGWRRYAA